MSNIISIEDLRREFLEKSKPKDVKEFVEKQQELLEKFMRECQELKKQLEHANDIIKNLGSPLTLNKDNSEELICIEQIQILKDRSKSRELDINDVKKLDILIKNLRLIRSQPTDNISVPYKDLSDSELIAIASANK